MGTSRLKSLIKDAEKLKSQLEKALEKRMNEARAQKGGELMSIRVAQIEVDGVLAGTLELKERTFSTGSRGYYGNARALFRFIVDDFVI
jgi:hypothetical protein